MGACASRPKDLDKEFTPIPAEEVATPEKTEQETPAPEVCMNFYTIISLSQNNIIKSNINEDVLFCSS